MTKTEKIVKELKDRILAIETRQQKLKDRCDELSDILNKYDEIDEEGDGE